MCVKSIDERNESTRSSDLHRVGSGSIAAIIAVAAAVLWAAPQAQSQTVIHVDKNSTGPVHDGSSWCSAYRELHEALAVAAAGMTIRVADGTYRPDATALADPREATFHLIDGVALEGGYAGCGGGDPDERDVTALETILHGDVNDDNDPNGDPGPGGGCCRGSGVPGCADASCLAKVCAVEPSCCGENWFFTCGVLARKWCCELCSDNLTYCDDSYHVVTGRSTNNTATLDGFVITGGRASNASGGDLYTGGGGMIIVSGDPTVTNCTFADNWSEGAGGAVYNYEGGPTFTNCTFHANTAGGLGGGMYNLNGAATLRNCTFTENVADELGGGLYTVSFHVDPTVENCTFVENRADVRGGGMYVEHGSPRLSRCTFVANWANISGGGMYVERGSTDLSGCTFVANWAEEGGGLYSRPESNLRLIDCAFRQNSAEFVGGGIYNASNAYLVRCVFTENTASGGGGLLNRGSDVSLINCIFLGNTAGDESGGGVSSSGIDLALTGCVLDGNSARRSGGGLAGDGTLTNCTFTGNSAGEAGGGIYGTGSLNNCVLWGNTSLLGTTESAQIAWFGANPPLVAYSCIQGLEVYGGNHNIDRNPLFVDADGPDDVPGTEDDDLRLSPGSPCIDAGDNDAVPPDSLDLDDDGDTEEPVPLDLDGGPRFLDDPNTSDTGNFGELGPPVVDMGAYEFRATVIVPLDIMPQRCPNRLPFKKKGILRIALLGTDWFDVMQVDPASLVLTRADGVGGAIAPLRTPPGPARKIRDVATPLNGEPCECHHLGKDGIDDLLLHIRGDKEIRALELRSVPDNTYVELILSGALWDGTAIEASDCVLVKHPTTPPTAASPRRKGRPRTP